MSEPFVGEIRIFAGNFVPRGWAFCNGGLLRISDHSALFSLLGTIYGGDGRTTFGLPDMRGRIPVHQGQGLGLTNRPIGAELGNEMETLTINQLPSHSHPSASTNMANLGGPSGNVTGDTGSNALYVESAPNVSLAAGANQAVGGGQAHNNMMPYLGLTFIIALVGIYPSRS